MEYAEQRFEGGRSESPVLNAMRTFNRFTANVDRRMANSGRSVTARRILIEIFEKPESCDIDVVKSLGLDRAFFSRSLKSLMDGGLVGSKATPIHRSQRELSLTEEGELRTQQLLEDTLKAIADELDCMDSRDRVSIVTAARSFLIDANRYISGQLEITVSKASDYGWFLSDIASSSPRHATWERISNFTEALADSFQDPWDLRWTAIRGSKPIGICILAVLPNKMDLELREVYLLPRSDRVEVGTLLVRAAVEHARLKEFASVTMNCNDENMWLRSILTSNDFKRMRADSTDISEGETISVAEYVL